VIYQSSGATLLLYVERAGLEPVLQRTVWLAPTPAPIIRDNGVELASGTGIEVLGEQANWLQIAVDFDGIQTLEGWIPRDAMGDSYTPLDLVVGEVNAEIQPGARVYRRPGKDPFVRIPALDPVMNSDEDTQMGAILDTRGRWQRIQFSDACGRSLRVTGWVSSKQTTQIEPFDPFVGCGRGGGDKPGLDQRAELPTIPVRKGQILLDRPHGRVIGELERDVKLASDRDGYVYLESVWGPIPAVLASPDARVDRSTTNAHLRFMGRDASNRPTRGDTRKLRAARIR